jgi:hypothetical protein
VPKLLEQNRQPVAHGRAIVDSKDQFLTNWEAFTKGMFKGLDWTNIFIAGGAVLGTPSPLCTPCAFLSSPTCLHRTKRLLTQTPPLLCTACLQPDGMTKYPTSDIDIFVHGIDDDEQANNLVRLSASCLVVMYKHGLTPFPPFPLHSVPYS